MQIALVLIMLPSVDLNIDTNDIHIGTPDRGLVTAIILAIVISILVIWLVPAVRDSSSPSTSARPYWPD